MHESPLHGKSPDVPPDCTWSKRRDGVRRPYFSGSFHIGAQFDRNAHRLPDLLYEPFVLDFLIQIVSAAHTGLPKQSFSIILLICVTACKSKLMLFHARGKISTLSLINHPFLSLPQVQTFLRRKPIILQSPENGMFQGLLKSVFQLSSKQDQNSDCSIACSARHPVMVCSEKSSWLSAS
jgi:hypothetical protein